MVPRKASLPYLQRMATQSLAAATEKLEGVEDASATTIDWCNAKLGMNIVLSIDYPPFNYNACAKGQKQKYDSKNKMVVLIEFDGKNRTVLTNIKFQRVWKKEMRLTMGIRAFVLMIPEDEEMASMATMKKYKEVVSRHTASNQGMSGVELTGVTFLDEKMELGVNSTASRGVDNDDDPPEGEKYKFQSGTY